MTGTSRRDLLKHASLGAVAVGVAAVAPVAVTGEAQAGSAPAGPAHDGALVAYVRDHRTGEIAVLVGEREVSFRDPAMAARLARVAATADQS